MYLLHAQGHHTMYRMKYTSVFMIFVILFNVNSLAQEDPFVADKVVPVRIELERAFDCELRITGSVVGYPELQVPILGTGKADLSPLDVTDFSYKDESNEDLPYRGRSPILGTATVTASNIRRIDVNLFYPKYLLREGCSKIADESGPCVIGYYPRWARSSTQTGEDWIEILDRTREFEFEDGELTIDYQFGGIATVFRGSPAGRYTGTMDVMVSCIPL